MNKEKIEWLDIAKGLGMVFVMLGHTPCPFFLEKYIFSFHVPLFFFLSGYLFSIEKYNKFKDFFNKKINRLIVTCYFISQQQQELLRLLFCQI